LTKDNDTLIVLSPGFPADESDTTCLPTQQNFIKALNKNFPDVAVIIFAFDYPFSEKEYYWFGNRVIPFNGYSNKKIRRLFLWRRIWKKMRQLRRENHFVGILSFWCSDCAMLGKKFAQKYQLKHYCWIMGQDAKKNNRYVKLIHPRSVELIALSDFLADEFYRNYEIRPAYIIPNAVAPQFFNHPLAKKDIDIVGVGSLIPLKRFDVFISIVGELKNQFPSISAIICGKGPEEDNLMAQIKEKSLEQYVSLIGERPYDEVLKLMQRSKILLHPSVYEGFSGVCLEALASRAHVISFTRAMSQDIDQWHIVKTKEEMIQQAVALLIDGTTYETIMPFTTDDTAKSVMTLFGIGKRMN